MRRSSLSARETVAGDTPATWATSASVARRWTFMRTVEVTNPSGGKIALRHRPELLSSLVYFAGAVQHRNAEGRAEVCVSHTDADRHGAAHEGICLGQHAGPVAIGRHARSVALERRSLHRGGAPLTHVLQRAVTV